MAVDYKINNFTYHFFQDWYHHEEDYHQGFMKQIYHKTCTTDNCKLTKEIFFAVIVRENINRKFNLEHLKKDYHKFRNFGIDLYTYIQYATPLHHLRLESVFDEILSLYAYMVTMVKFCYERENNLYIYTMPECCSIYFDTELKEEFYKFGGWDEFHRQALSYSYIPIVPRESESDIENAIYLLMRLCGRYELTFVVDYCHKILKQRLRADGTLDYCCLKCCILFGGFAVFKPSFDNSSADMQHVEGILRMIRCLPWTLVQQSKYHEQPSCTSLPAESEKQQLNESSNSSTITNLETGTQESVSKEINNNTEFSGDDYKAVTDQFLWNMFADFEDEPDEVPPGSCCYCFKDCSESQKSLERSSLSDSIKNTILNKIRGYSSPDKEFQPIEPNHLMPPDEKEDLNLTQVSEIFDKLTISEYEHVPRNSTLIDQPLRMFIALGIEPLRTEILASFDEKSNLQNNDEYSANEKASNVKKKRNHRKRRRKKNALKNKCF